MQSEIIFALTDFRLFFIVQKKQETFHNNINRIRMGCGVVCGSEKELKNDYLVSSQRALQQLIPLLFACPPLVKQQSLAIFMKQARQDKFIYQLQTSEKINLNQQIGQFVREKWCLLLYGQHKNNQNYSKCIGFIQRNDFIKRQSISNDLPLMSKQIIKNESYHQIKAATQYHECFGQIEKDLNRTFDFKQDKITIFEKVLKRIANHFPSMGYTQGVNFVVGYLLLLGYSESDTFWLFVHLALNKRYLILGLYEDSFPLAYLYSLIFKNMLKRLDQKLWNHIYNNLQLDDSLWIFKWFVTYYIYSFPTDSVKYVWDAVIQLGGFGLIYYALSLVIELKQFILREEDTAQVTMLFQNLKHLEFFNQHININKILKNTYSFCALKQDFEGIRALPSNFYTNYYTILLQEGNFNEIINKKKEDNDSTNWTRYPTNNNKSEEFLNLWYKNIKKEREQFKENDNQVSAKLIELPKLMQTEFEEMEKSIMELEQKIIANDSLKFQSFRQYESPFNEILNASQSQNKPKDDLKYQIKGELSLTPLNNCFNQEQCGQKKLTSKVSYDIAQEIGQLENEEDSHSENDEYESIYVDEIKIQKRKEKVILDQLDKLAKNHSQLKGKTLKVNSLYPNYQQKSKHFKDQRLKVNNFQLNKQDKRTGLSIVGQNILGNISGTNTSHFSSQLSGKNEKVRPKRQKQNNLSHFTKNLKVRTQEACCLSVQASEHSSLQNKTDKDSVSNLSQKEPDLKAQRSDILIPDIRQRLTHQDLMINSHVPQKNDTKGNYASSQIQIFNGNQLFKKKKKIYNRNFNVTSLGANQPSVNQIQIDGQMNQKAQLQTYQEEESCESYFIPSTNRRLSNRAEKNMEIELYQIQSLK